MPMPVSPSGQPLAAQPSRIMQGRYGPMTPEMQARGWSYNASGLLLDGRGNPIDAQGRPLGPGEPGDNGNPYLPPANTATRSSPVPGAASPNQQPGYQTVPGVRPAQQPQGPAQGPAPVPGEAPSPQGAAPQRSYDAKGHASDGSQSIGDDNPWKIGAIVGGTYDPQTMEMWVGKAKAGDPAAAQLLGQVGYRMGMTPDQWIAERKLDTYVADERSPWAHDPGYSEDYQGFTEGQGYGSMGNAQASYGWWDEDKGFDPKTGPREAAQAPPQAPPAQPPAAAPPAAPPPAQAPPSAPPAAAGMAQRRLGQGGVASGASKLPMTPVAMPDWHDTDPARGGARPDPVAGANRVRDRFKLPKY